jgi:catechol 2,3-dioxygenase-like lactoylglutathione lyase family enzyme
MAFEITLDVNDPELMIDFWSSILRYKLVDAVRYHDLKQIYWSLVDPNNIGPRLIIQRVPEPVTSKTRIHFEADAKRAIEKGAKRVDDKPINEVGATWLRMLDPEGNHFCFVLNREK